MARNLREQLFAVRVSKFMRVAADDILRLALMPCRVLETVRFDASCFGFVHIVHW